MIPEEVVKRPLVLTEKGTNLREQENKYLFEVARGRYRSGVGSVLDLLAAQSALASARAQQVEARLAWSVSLAQLAHDAGVLDPRGGNPLRLTTDTTSAPSR